MLQRITQLWPSLLQGNREDQDETNQIQEDEGSANQAN